MPPVNNISVHSCRVDAEAVLELKALTGKCYELRNNQCFTVLFSKLLVLRGYVICVN